MIDHTNNSISTVEDVIAYLHNALSSMRTYPLEDDFQEGYERAFNDVMYHLLSASTAKANAGALH
jgi:hypothetical protein